MPISRLVAVSLRPASSVRSRTLASTGRELRLLTARLTVDRPRARFSCITESFTSGLPLGGACPFDIFSPRHRHHAVDGVGRQALAARAERDTGCGWMSRGPGHVVGSDAAIVEHAPGSPTPGVIRSTGMH